MVLHTPVSGVLALEYRGNELTSTASVIYTKRFNLTPDNLLQAVGCTALF
jgi:hypothetical protein